MAFTFNISPGSTTPIYRQICEQIRLGMATGKLAISTQLPSVRALAEELVVNPNTVARAYSELAREGIIETRAGRGVFVTQKRRVFTPEERWRRLEPLLDGLMSEAMALDYTPEDLREVFEKKLAVWKPAKGNQ